MYCFYSFDRNHDLSTIKKLDFIFLVFIYCYYVIIYFLFGLQTKFFIHEKKKGFANEPTLSLNMIKNTYIYIYSDSP